MSDFQTKILKIQQHYLHTRDLSQLQNDLQSFANQCSDHFGVGDYLITIGEQLIDSGNYEAGIAFIIMVYQRFRNIVNHVTLYLRMAQYYIESGDNEAGVDFLVKLCNQTVDNYEESIEFNGLTDVWEQYKPLVVGRVPESISVHSSSLPLPPEKCSMEINEILSLPVDELLSSLSTHLSELSANGTCLNFLNKWEKTVFYIDELCAEVNSGGFSHYLYYYGNHFDKTIKALETIRADSALSLMESVQNKFPRRSVPKTLDSIQNAVDKIEEKGIDFDREDSRFYEMVESTLLHQLHDYVIENQNHFR
jgi:hypothetical protein